jgi:glycosyltransferase involved in cell wall biosynthesis
LFSKGERVPRVVILQEYVPGYRVAFFEELKKLCNADGIELEVACGKPNVDQGRRGDEAKLSFARVIAQREWSILGRRLVLRRVRKVLRESDLVIMEQARRNVDVYRLLLPKRVGNHNVALWGHGKDYTRPTQGLDRVLQRLLTARAAWFFAYTGGGLEAVAAQGYNRAKITVVQNSIDTAALRASIEDVSTAMVDAFSLDNDLEGRSAIFVGALDNSKRLPFLIEAAMRCHEEDQSFRLLIAGDGPLRQWVEKVTEEHTWLTYLGPLSGTNKALALASAQVLAMPGRVGLVAVDSFSAGVPIVTTNWPWHAPEFEYLMDGVNAIITIDSVSSYAQNLLQALRDEDLLSRLRTGCDQSARDITVSAMAENFLGGIHGALALGAA